MDKTKIEWTRGDDGSPGYTFNPWWGCMRVSPACEHCYAETFSKRIGGSPWAKGNHWGPKGLRTIASAKQWAEPLRWARLAKAAGTRARVFCGSMCDYLEDETGDSLDNPTLKDARSRLWDLIEQTADDLDWLLLTKRAHALRYVPEEIARRCWMGVTVEDQRRAEERIPHLLAVPARVRFLSCEPLLGPVQFLPSWVAGYDYADCRRVVAPRIDWVIVGGESGSAARPFRIEWARELVEQCRSAGVACFVKQLGADPRVNYYDDQAREWFDRVGFEWPDPIGWSEHDGQPQLDAVVSIRGPNWKKGGDIEQFPPELRVREFPKETP
jgi:protein gp37